MLDDLRKKSPSIKEAYAFWGALLLTVLIGAIWLIVLSVNLSQNEAFAELEEGKERAGAFAQFFGQIKDNVSNTWQENKEVLNNLSAETATKNSEGDEENESTATATSTPTVSTTGSTILIATSSQKDIKIATSSKQND
ncbi:hypothetical protein H6788_00480 [Candidatus Nomurabacteria bacterium]|nr:hypothetical protein [Candidatus Nomurabacteria bacterium]MCB9819439.1 hypothetical protein [Candidatus Nomurabacteria bacterium]